MKTDESDERSKLVLQILDRVAAGTYDVAVEDVADAIIAGPVPLDAFSMDLFGGFGRSSDPAQDDDNG